MPPLLKKESFPMSKRIDWQSWNKVESFLRHNPVTRGEEKELTSDELERINIWLLTVAREVDAMEAILAKGRSRFAV